MPLPHALTCSRRARFTLNPLRHVSNKRPYTRPSFAPKPVLDLKHIRQNPGLYEQNAIDRNYAASSKNGWRILELHQKLLVEQSKAVEFRQRGNVLSKLLASQDADADLAARDRKDEARKEAKGLKESLAAIARLEKETQAQMERLAMELPNLSSLSTPVGEEARVVGWVNREEKPEVKQQGGGGGKSHVDIGKELDLLDFQASATTSGWGWYFLKNEAALLEQALIQYALSVAMARGWKVMTPPSLVYSHIASACGFMPRDQNGETQIYNIAQPETDGDDKLPSEQNSGRIRPPPKSHRPLTLLPRRSRRPRRRHKGPLPRARIHKSRNVRLDQTAAHGREQRPLRHGGRRRSGVRALAERSHFPGNAFNPNRNPHFPRPARSDIGNAFDGLGRFCYEED
jgi:hypothetical protein